MVIPVVNIVPVNRPVVEAEPVEDGETVETVCAVFVAVVDDPVWLVADNEVVPVELVGIVVVDVRSVVPAIFCKISAIILLKCDA